jgi:hypothetical protein
MKAGMLDSMACDTKKYCKYTFVVSFIIFCVTLLALLLFLSFSSGRQYESSQFSVESSIDKSEIIQSTGTLNKLQSALKGNPLSGIHNSLHASNIRNNKVLKLQALVLQICSAVMILSVFQRTGFPAFSIRIPFFQIFLKTISPVRAGPILC